MREQMNHARGMTKIMRTKMERLNTSLRLQIDGQDSQDNFLRNKTIFQLVHLKAEYKHSLS